MNKPRQMFDQVAQDAKIQDTTRSNTKDARRTTCDAETNRHRPGSVNFRARQTGATTPFLRLTG
jgi:hypothetical protein